MITSSSALENPTHTYTNRNTYTPALTVTNALGLVSSRQGSPITVALPSVKITASKVTGSSSLTVQFKTPTTDTGGNKITSWSWNFGDNTPLSTEPSPSHTYASAGTFQPLLTVVNACTLSWQDSGPAITVNGVNPSELSKSLITVNQPPTLSLVISGANAIVSWPTNSTVYTLQSSTNLTPPANWNAVTSAPVVVDGQNVVTNTVSSPQMFFRLTQ